MISGGTKLLPEKAIGFSVPIMMISKKKKEKKVFTDIETVL